VLVVVLRMVLILMFILILQLISLLLIELKSVLVYTHIQIDASVIVLVYIGIFVV